ncbi:MAG: ECF-type sigma factor [Zavarzinella sp.]
MKEDPPFSDFIERIRNGDALAAEQLIKRFEPAIRVIVRSNISSSMRAKFDSVDICQSVMGTFFMRAAMGQYDLDNPQQLIALLARIAQNKVRSAARYFQQERRSQQREVAVDHLGDIFGNHPTPDRIVEEAELLEKLRNALTTEEREIADRRQNRQDWQQIALEMGGTAEGRRKQFARAMNRAAHDLGLEEDDEQSV